MKPAYKVIMVEARIPLIVKSELTDVEGVSWREAKKQLRKWFTDEAKKIRAEREPK